MAGYTAMVLGFAVAHPEYWPAWGSVLAGYVLVITTTLALSDAARGQAAPSATPTAASTSHARSRRLVKRA